MPKQTEAQRMTAQERQNKFEQKQFERLNKAREEKARKDAMFNRGVPKAKPLTEGQLIEQELKRQLLKEQKAAIMKTQQEMKAKHEARQAAFALEQKQNSNERRKEKRSSQISANHGSTSLQIKNNGFKNTLNEEIDDFEL